MVVVGGRVVVVVGAVVDVVVVDVVDVVLVDVDVVDVEVVLVEEVDVVDAGSLLAHGCQSRRTTTTTRANRMIPMAAINPPFPLGGFVALGTLAAVWLVHLVPSQ